MQQAVTAGAGEVAQDRPAILATRKLTAGYHDERIIYDIDVDFVPGTITSLVGGNGAGKSTLLKSLFGLTRLFDGAIIIDGHERRPSARDFVEQGINYVPQTANVFPSLSVRENLEVGTYVRKGHGVEGVLEVFPALRGLLTRSGRKLSGGERNMLAVGRALMSAPRLLLLDEPTGGLAPALAETFWQYLSSMAGSGIGIVAVEQNVDLALKYAQHVYVLGSGRIVAEGSAREIAERTDLEQLFLVSTPAP